MEEKTVTQYLPLCLLIGSLLAFVKVIESLYHKGKTTRLLNDSLWYDCFTLNKFLEKRKRKAQVQNQTRDILRSIIHKSVYREEIIDATKKFIKTIWVGFEKLGFETWFSMEINSYNHFGFKFGLLVGVDVNIFLENWKNEAHTAIALLIN